MFKEMQEKSIQFYKLLNIDILQKDIILAVTSLTMPQYAKEYKDKYNLNIGDHRARATVGDAVCGAFVMLEEYTEAMTSNDLNDSKARLQNEKLNLVGERMLKGVLFASNNDLESNNEDHPNKKAYATAFEAVIGFIALLDKNQNTNNADRILKEQLSNV